MAKTKYPAAAMVEREKRSLNLPGRPRQQRERDVENQSQQWRARRWNSDVSGAQDEEHVTGISQRKQRDHRQHVVKAERQFWEPCGFFGRHGDGLMRPFFHWRAAPNLADSNRGDDYAQSSRDGSGREHAAHAEASDNCQRQQRASDGAGGIHGLNQAIGGAER